MEHRTVIKARGMWHILYSVLFINEYAQDEGPLELTRRQKVLVWNDEVEITDENIPAVLSGPGLSRIPPRSPQARVQTPPADIPSSSSSRRRHSVTDFPPPMRRVSSEHSRPVSFSAKFSRVHPATTGVTVLEHMERLDAVEAGLKRLGVEGDDEEEEVDVGTVRPKAKKKQKQKPEPRDTEAAPLLLSPSAQSERLPTVTEVDSAPVTDDAASMTEEDLVAMSKSMPQLEPSPTGSRWASPSDRANLDWMDIDSTMSPRRRIMIAEVSTISLLGKSRTDLCV